MFATRTHRLLNVQMCSFRYSRERARQKLQIFANSYQTANLATFAPGPRVRRGRRRGVQEQRAGVRQRPEQGLGAGAGEGLDLGRV